MTTTTMNKTRPTRRRTAALLLNALALACGLSTALSAGAHVTIANPKASAGSYVKVVLQVPHGCAGSATKAITVTVPPELLAAKPMPKPGWSLVTETAPLAKPVQLHGKPLNESTALIRWEGGRLPGEFFDEFVVFGKIADGAQGKLAFKTLQTCEKSEVDWNGEAGSDSPAPILLVEPAAPSAASAAHPH